MQALRGFLSFSSRRYSFDKRVRMGADNPTIADMARVKCPPELVELTQVERSDDPDTYEILEENRPSAYQVMRFTKKNIKSWETYSYPDIYHNQSCQ